MSTLVRPVHLASRHKVSPLGIYVNTACGVYVILHPSRRTDDRALVTCKSCQRTRAFKEGTT